jgi:hypothetical protein
VQNVKLYNTNNESSSNNEIEEQLPQMMRFFEGDGKQKLNPSKNVIQYKLDLSEGFIDAKSMYPTRKRPTK